MQSELIKAMLDATGKQAETEENGGGSGLRNSAIVAGVNPDEIEYVLDKILQTMVTTLTGMEGVTREDAAFILGLFTGLELQKRRDNELGELMNG